MTIPGAEESGRYLHPTVKGLFPSICCSLLRVGCRSTQLLHATKPLSTGSWWREAEVEARSQYQSFGSVCYSSMTGDSHGQGQAFQVLPMCIVQVCFLRESHPKSTSSFYFAHKLSPSLFIFFSNLESSFPSQVRLKKSSLHCGESGAYDAKVYIQRRLAIPTVDFLSECECNLV